MTCLDAMQVFPPDGDSYCPCASTQCVGGACRPGPDGTCPIPTTHFKELDLTPGQTVKVMSGHNPALTRPTQYIRAGQGRPPCLQLKFNCSVRRMILPHCSWYDGRDLCLNRPSWSGTCHAL